MHPLPERCSRRGLLGAAAGITAAAAVAPAPARAERRRVTRIAHLTDVHVQPELSAGEGMAACLRHVQALQDRPDLLFTGGDLIMDAFATNWERAKIQWDLWQRVLREECSLPVVHCIGNHDVWGWNKRRSGCTGNEPLYGKKAAQEMLGLPERYYHRDVHGWRLFVLDSTHTDGDNGYTARLDEAQWEWLAGELAATPSTTPVLVLSHIPILCGCAFLDGENEKTGNWVVPGAWMHTDARRLKDLFYRHRNVKLCLSGHIHLRDRLDYNGVTYLCNGAVSGAWWKGNYQETPPGYAVVNLYSDGSFDHDYVTYR
jgi:Icc protein